MEREEENGDPGGNTGVLEQRSEMISVQLRLIAHLLVREFLGATSGDDCLVVHSVLVVLVTKHGVVRDQAEHDHVLGEDDQHQHQDRQQHPPGWSPPCSDLVESQAATPDPDISDPRHRAEQQEQHLTQE